MKTIETWLPVFPGFYGTWYETDSDEEMELDHINQERQDKGLPEIEWDQIEWDWDAYKDAIGKDACEVFENNMDAFLTRVEFESISSPREYNFTNDSINCAIHLTEVNKKTIMKFLKDHAEEWARYLRDTYTSYDGFLSRYSNNTEEWSDQSILDHSHKLGAVLQFIYYHHMDEQGIDDLDYDFYEAVKQDNYLTAKNYDDCVNNIYCPECHCWVEPADAVGTVCRDCFEFERHTGDTVVCCDCLSVIENKWEARQYRFKIKHGIIRYDQVICNDCKCLSPAVI